MERPTSAHTTIGKTNDTRSDSHQHDEAKVKRGEFVCITTRMCDDHHSGRAHHPRSTCTAQVLETRTIQVKGENPGKEEETERWMTKEFSDVESTVIYYSAFTRSARTTTTTTKRK